MLHKREIHLNIRTAYNLFLINTFSHILWWQIWMIRPMVCIRVNFVCLFCIVFVLCSFAPLSMSAENKTVFKIRVNRIALHVNDNHTIQYIQLLINVSVGSFIFVCFCFIFLWLLNNNCSFEKRQPNGISDTANVTLDPLSICSMLYIYLLAV